MGRQLSAGGFAARVAGVDLGSSEALVGRATSRVFWVVAAFGLYMSVAGLLDRAWLRIVGRIRLLNTGARFVWINSFLAVTSVASVAVIVSEGVTSAAGRVAFVAIVALSLLPGLNQLTWVYDAVCRRVLAFHVLLAPSEPLS